MRPRNTSEYAATAPWPHYAEDEVAAAVDVLRSGRVNYWTGEGGRAFEREYAEHFGCRHAIALANGTVALELALYALGVGPGDDVIVPARTFIASASAAVMRGATPVICDVDRDSGDATAETIAAVLTPRTRAIIAVHLAGWPCDMEPIMQLARDRGLYVIEDCAQCHGAMYRGQYAGTFGDIAAWSFCQDKIISTGGEGGMMTTDNADWWRKAWAFKDHGKSWEAVYEREHAPGFRWLHEDFGTNWRMTEMQAAIGRRQLTKLAAWVEARRRHAQILIDALSPLSAMRVPVPGPDLLHAYYKFYAYVRPDALKRDWPRDRMMAEITARGVFCHAGGCGEIYREKAFAKAVLSPADRLPVARELGETSLMFQVHPTLSDAQMTQHAEVIAQVVREATR
jgi:dTDP-4-amino-4,6-dideoxygalactose transaminase